MIYLPDTGIYSTMPHFIVRDTNPITWERDVEGRDGYELGCETFSEGAVEATLDLDDPYVDIEANPIDLTPFIGIRKRIYFRFTSGAFSADDRIDFIIYAGLA